MNVQDILTPAGPHAGRILDLLHVTVSICLIVFVLVLAAFFYALWRGSRGGSSPRLAPAAVVSAIVVSTAGLLFLIVASVTTDRALANLPQDNPLTIEVTGHQWWWDVRYLDDEPSRLFTTANEIHIPVGRPVAIKLKADDVIHSFWAPNLGGKKDLIPGREATITLLAEKPGTYRGQCAEFCGAQHAKMAFQVFAEPAEQYEAWAAQQRKPAPEPADPAQKRGREVFEQGTCAMCHAIQGTQANARRAPDLTHLASRSTLAAGTVPNTRGHLAGWIIDPHSIKPGVNMPSNALAPDDLQALLAFLGSLK
ncbi:MAG TPA: cytochrome c oxidase subunit II [Burkholderiales bacterium]|nr:cytochrome c oxidase subunit II [Burkholderiales bacterium]